MDKEPRSTPRSYVTPLKITNVGGSGHSEEKQSVEQPEVVNDWQLLDSLPKLTSSQVYAFLGAGALAIFSLIHIIYSHLPWPGQKDILPEVGEAPRYSETDRMGFTIQKSNYKWDIMPTGVIEVSGLVLAAEIPSKWTTVAELGRVLLISSDLTKAWGENVLGGYYKKGQFGNSGGQEFANNPHPKWNDREYRYFALLTDDNDIARAIQQIRPGDQCFMKGLTVRYQLRGGEGGVVGDGHPVVYVQEFRVLRKHNHIPRLIAASALWTSLALFGLAVFNKIFPPQEDGA